MKDKPDDGECASSELAPYRTNQTRIYVPIANILKFNGIIH